MIIQYGIQHQELTELRDMASYSNIEAFSELGNQYDYTDGDDYIKISITTTMFILQFVLEISGNSNIDNHRHAYLFQCIAEVISTVGWEMNDHKDGLFCILR